MRPNCFIKGLAVGVWLTLMVLVLAGAARGNQFELGQVISLSPDVIVISDGTDTGWFTTATDTVITPPIYIGGSGQSLGLWVKAVSSGGAPNLYIDFVQSYSEEEDYNVPVGASAIINGLTAETAQMYSFSAFRMPWIKLRFIGLSGNGTDTGVEAAIYRPRTEQAASSSDVAQATQGDAVITRGIQAIFEAKDFDASAFPNPVDEGDAVRGAASLYGVQYSMIVGEDGSSSPYDETNDALDVQITNAYALQSQSVTLFDATVLDDDPTSAVSGIVPATNYALKTICIEVDSTAAPDSVRVWFEYSPDNSSWFGEESKVYGVPFTQKGTTYTVFHYEDDAEDVLELPIWVDYFRMNIKAYGSDATNMYTVTAIATLRGGR